MHTPRGFEVEKNHSACITGRAASSTIKPFLFLVLTRSVKIINKVRWSLKYGDLVNISIVD